jgi:hypothetical protein
VFKNPLPGDPRKLVTTVPIGGLVTLVVDLPVSRVVLALVVVGALLVLWMAQQLFEIVRNTGLPEASRALDERLARWIGGRDDSEPKAP